MPDVAREPADRFADEPLLVAVRRSTRGVHEALERRLRFGGDNGAGTNPVTRAGYVRFLRASRAALAGIEPVVAHVLEPSPTSRLAALRDDLRSLGEPASASAPSGSVRARRRLDRRDRGALHGAAYVLEGSGLGGLVLAARVEPVLGSGALRYLRLRGEDTAAAWHRFLRRLDEFGRSATAPERRRVLAAARATFGIYARAFAAEGLLAGAHAAETSSGS